MDQRPNASRRKQRQAGFTLIELMIVITIVGGLIVIALPSLNDMIVNQKVKGLANELFFDLSYARSEAIKRNITVQVVRTGADWTGGWTVEIAGPVVLRTQPGTKGITASGATDASVSFNSDGRSALGGNLSFNFTTGSSVVSMRCVLLTPSGRPAVRIDRNRNGDCADG
jgi:type IV fimbrial biogenesis protein FimT